MGKLNYSIEFRNGTNAYAPPREQILIFKVYSNNLGVPTARIYEEGTGAPAYTALTAISGGYQFFGGPALLGGKTYILDYKDNAIESQLFKFVVRNNNLGAYKGNINYNAAQEIISISCSNGSLTVYYNVTSNEGFSNTVSIDGGSTYRGNYYDDRYGGNRYVASWSESELLAAGYGGQVPSITFKTFYPGEAPQSVINFAQVNFLQPSFTALGASYVATNCSANGANDGTISVNVTGGSGSFTYAWSDGPVTKNRAGLSPGLYTIVITDTLTTLTTSLVNIPITEPQPPPPLPNIGTVLDPVPTNPVPFVPETLEEGAPQTLDNKLFCKQYHKGYLRGKYFNPYQKTDPLVYQFNGNFDGYTLEMYNYDTKLLVNSYAVVQKQENAGVATDYAIRIQNHTIPGKSRVYSQTQNITDLVQNSIGDVFEIVNNVDGFNGLYAIVDIGFDYFVITKNYAIAPAYSNGTGRFISSSQNYNVYESTIDLLAVADGYYFFKLTGNSDNTLVKISEPIDVRVSHPGTVGISYRNIDNSFGTVWTTGFTGFVRVPASFFKRIPGGERSVTRSADYKLIKINAKKKRIVQLEIFNIPPYIVELLSLAFDCDYFTINGVEFQCEEGLGDPEYRERMYLANVIANVEQVNWVSGYNGNDVGTVSNGGFLMTEQGFLKR